ncbi:hypothetical protein D3Z39_12920 [Anaerotruncus colihominis]|uniref:Uncharacterized protein n=1 Tax=Anaerotruncus colihominis TaxID=169435 RepID=A0A845RQ55_9FIRM|nr:hypothetical protein [Anaerotruncus colihominis]
MMPCAGAAIKTENKALKLAMPVFKPAWPIDICKIVRPMPENQYYSALNKREYKNLEIYTDCPK